MYPLPIRPDKLRGMSADEARRFVKDNGLLPFIQGGDETAPAAAELPQTEEDLRGRTPDELRQIVERFTVRLRELHQTDAGELRLLDATEQAAFDIGMKVRTKAMAMLEEHGKIADALRTKPKAFSGVNQIIQDSVDVRSVVRMSVPEARTAALRAIGNKELTAHLDDAALRQVEKTVRKNTDIARRILVTENDEYKSAYVKAMTRATPIFTDEERDAMLAWEEYRAASEGTSSAGGYGIPVFIDPSIILTAQGSSNPFLQIAKQVDVNTNAWKGVSSAGVSWSFDAEGSAVSDDAATLAQPAVTVFMARGFIPYTIEIGMDYPDFAGEMATLLAVGYDELLVDKFSRGVGSTTEPQGIITALDANTNAEVRLTTAGAFGEVDLYNVWKALPQRFRRNASWMMSVGANNAIRRFGTANVYHATTITLPGGWADSLFLRGVYESPYFPDVVGTTGPWNQLVVGDFSNYLIARRGGMNTELIPALFDVTNNRPTGSRGWFAYARIGGGSINDVGFRLLNQT